MVVPVQTVGAFLDELHYLGAAQRGIAWSDEFGVIVLGGSEGKPTTRRESDVRAVSDSSADLQVLCLTCWLQEKYGEPYPATHTGLGPYCPVDRWGIANEQPLEVPLPTIEEA